MLHRQPMLATFPLSGYIPAAQGINREPAWCEAVATVPGSDYSLAAQGCDRGEA